MPLAAFHPAVRQWFEQTLGEPTDVQSGAWPAIAHGDHTLLAAPTGSGKTLAAFLAAIDALVREGMARGLRDETRVLYISPLKALSNDIRRNLEAPLNGIRDQLAQSYPLNDVCLRACARTGDTPRNERQIMARRPPHILVTTPESVYILLSCESGRRMLRTVRTVIVDELHALASNKRGAHLALSLERLEALCERPPSRIGLSATQKPIARMARFLLGDRDTPCHIIDTGHERERDLGLELPDAPLEAVMSNETFALVYDRLAALARAHRTTLVFVNTRRLCERAARHLGERLGNDVVTSHHGSLARAHRLDAEQRLKRGELKVLVATASLELGIDIGTVDLVCQLGSPHAIAAFLQRVGRSGHAVQATPRGRLFPLSHDDLVECVALLDGARSGLLDAVEVPRAPLDVLAQQIVAEVAAREWSEDALYATLRRAWPYRDLERGRFDEVVSMLAAGFSTRRGRRGAHLHHDTVNGRLRGRRGARTYAITNGGAIPDQFDYDVVLAPEGLRVGTLGEDFAFESMPGDIFQLGNTSYRILKVETSRVLVEDAHGQPPSIPFWFGESPGRTDELSRAVSELRRTVDARLGDTSPADLDAVMCWAAERFGLVRVAAEQMIEHLAAARAALGLLPTHERIVLERFFDETGDMHLVVHSTYGSRLNRAWGLALRKRFCRKFNFELQAAALEDSLVLSLGPTHSFPLDEVVAYLSSANVREVLTQALLDAPVFATRWRWNATTALAVRRNHHGKRVPPQFQRNDAEDLVAVVFPDQLACLENITGRREIPDHPLVRQTIADCLEDNMDITGLEALLARLERGETTVAARDLAGPSALSQSILAARPYAFLDDAPAEERRTRAVRATRFGAPQDARALGRLDTGAIARVQRESWPEPRSADELHDALVVLGFITRAEAMSSTNGGGSWQRFFDELRPQRRVIELAPHQGEPLWIAAERAAEVAVLLPESPAANGCPAPASSDRDTALRELVRSRMEALGPVTAAALGMPLGLPASAIDPALLALETEGCIVRGQFAPTGADETQWWERRLLARAHRYTLKRLRSETEPVSAASYMRFLLAWHGVGDEVAQGPAALDAALQRLEGFAAPAAAWESDLLRARVADFSPEMLDSSCSAGRTLWLRIRPGAGNGGERSGPVRNTPVALLTRAHVRNWRALAPAPDGREMPLSAPAQAVRKALLCEGALFGADLVEATELPAADVQRGLAELVARGFVHSDTFAGLRGLITRSRHHRAAGLGEAGRWVLLREPRNDGAPVLEPIAWALLRRWGVVFRKVLERETLLPPWRELLRVYWRLEARGEIRGGRFVEGFAGEQFALPEAVGLLRESHRAPRRGLLVSVAAADPLNLTGVLLPGERVATALRSRVLLRDGTPVASLVGGDVRLSDGLSQEDARLASAVLQKHRGRTASAAGTAAASC